MRGEILAALYSYGSCQRARELEIFALLSKILAEPAGAGENSEVFKELRKKLKELKPYPYYQLIAMENNISDPFLEEVVRAYWTGNELLKKFPVWKNPYHHNFTTMEDAEIFSQHFGWKMVVANLNLCRVWWGKVKEVKESGLKIETTLLRYKEGKFSEGSPREISIKKGLLKEVAEGNLVSVHWLEAREFITAREEYKLAVINSQFIDFLNR